MHLRAIEKIFRVPKSLAPLPTYVPEGTWSSGEFGGENNLASSHTLPRYAWGCVGGEILEVAEGIEGRKTGREPGRDERGDVLGGGRSEGSRATCTRQQPPTSEELIINLLSPSQTPL